MFGSESWGVMVWSLATPAPVLGETGLLVLAGLLVASSCAILLLPRREAGADAR